MKRLLGLLIICCISCSGQKEKPSQLNNIERAVATQWGKVDFRATEYFFYDQRIQYLMDLKSKAERNSEVLDILIASEYLKKGDYETSIEILELLKSNNLQQTEDIQYRLLQQLGLSYMRMAEQENCIKHHSFESCIVPIQNSGIHNLSDGSSKAINQYEELLGISPEDYTSIWLLNLAYMTLDQYPSGVPREYLIPEEAFQSDLDISRFRDISRSTNTNLTGLSGGVCVDDFNQDGFLDIIASSWGIEDQVEILMNNGDGTFENVTDKSGLTGTYGGLNMVHTDYNNDGHLDFLILRGAWFEEQGGIPNSLIRNNGDGTFSDVTIESGVYSEAPTQTATWADINLDGWVDLFIGNETTTDKIFLNELYINNQDGSFTNITNSSGLKNSFGYVKGCTFGDVDNDGLADLYISYYDRTNRLFKNISTPDRVEFTDITLKAGVGQPVISFPTWFWDFDNDGFLDLFVSGYGNGSGKESATQVMANYFGHDVGGNPRLFRNEGNGSFKDITRESGLQDAIFTMGSNYGDLNNDGYSDFYLGTGDPDFTSIYPNRMFLNKKGEEFADVTTAGGFGHIQKGHGIAFSDLDNDGDQDIYMVVGGAHTGDFFENALFENPGNDNSWITLVLEGTQSNRKAIGARIKIEALNNDGSVSVYHHFVSTGGSFGSASLQIEAGLGSAKSVSKLTIQWPNFERSISTFTDLEINQVVSIKEGQDQYKRIILSPVNFNDMDNALHSGH